MRFCTCLAISLLFPLFAGCGATTETGYKPRKLGDSITVQRGYYAAPFSPEARDAQRERDQGMVNPRPDIR